MEQTLPRMVREKARTFSDRTALRRKEEGTYRDIGWADLERNLLVYGRALIALGIGPGDRVAIMAPNSPEWAYVDLGAMSCGAVSVPVYHTEGLSTLLYILKDAGSRLLFIQSVLVAEELLEKLDEVPGLERVVLLEGDLDHPRVLTLETFLEGAQKTEVSALEAPLSEATSEDLASIVYTSGTTGDPKGVMLSHGNILYNVETCSRLFELDADDQCLSFLPLSHTFERTAGYYFMLYQGVTIAYAESIDTVPNNMTEVRPTVMISVPRLYEKMYARVMERVLSGPWLRKQIFFFALKLGRACVNRELAGESPNPLLLSLTRLARSTVFGKLKDHLGGRLRFFVSGGAPLSKRIAEFFLAAGIPIYEGYGLTETSPVIAANTPGAQRLGTVGRPLPGTEVRIAEDGEILVRGPGVFQGYWQNGEATEEVLSSDGWLQTGDVGELDEEGFLTITDRKKDLIVTAGGENIAPQVLENRFKTDKFLANALVYGDGKPYLTALLVPNFDNLESYARTHDINFLDRCDLVDHPSILELIRRRIDRLQEGLPSIQQIKRFTLLSQDFSKEEMTPTLKVRRNVVQQHLHHVLEQMYLPQGHGAHDSGFCLVDEENP